MHSRNLQRAFTQRSNSDSSSLKLEDGSRVAVLGGGPAGSFFSFFLLEMARRAGLEISLDIFERRDFSTVGPGGCNMCGGIISESLVQTLATEGINLPPTVVERGIDSYVLHMDEGSVHIETPLHEKRIGSVHRGAGPRGLREKKWGSFDGHLLDLAVGNGANLIRGRVDEIVLSDGKPTLGVKGGEASSYDLLTVATGVNTSTLKIIENLGIPYRSPKTTATYISEYYIGNDLVEKTLGSSMHVFLLAMDRVEFAAIIPKGDFISVCILGHGIDDKVFHSFLGHPSVRTCFPEGWAPPPDHCHCAPRMNVRGAVQPYGDRIVFIGDAGASRLYKDGIGAAYRTAKAAANTAVFEGISSAAFKKHYAPACRRLEFDNSIGKAVFLVTKELQRRGFERRAVLTMTAKEQLKASGRRMSTVLWDTFTGSSSYREIFIRSLHPFFLGTLFRELAAALVSRADGWTVPSPKKSPPAEVSQ